MKKILFFILVATVTLSSCQAQPAAKTKIELQRCDTSGLVKYLLQTIADYDTLNAYYHSSTTLQARRDSATILFLMHDDPKDLQAAQHFEALRRIAADKGQKFIALMNSRRKR